MASLNISFDRDGLPEGQSFEIIPEGWYEAKIKSAEEKKTKAGNGTYLNLQFELDNKRVVFGTINTKNPSIKAEEIGLGQLKQLMGALGLTRLSDSDQLVGANLTIKVGVSKPQEGYDQRNEVRAYKALDGGIPPMPVGQKSTITIQPGKSPPPWASKKAIDNEEDIRS